MRVCTALTSFYHSPFSLKLNFCQKFDWEDVWGYPQIVTYLDDTRSIAPGLERGTGILGFQPTRLYMIGEHLSKFDNLYPILYNCFKLKPATKNLSLQEDVRRSNARLA